MSILLSVSMSILTSNHLFHAHANRTAKCGHLWLIICGIDARAPLCITEMFMFEAYSSWVVTNIFQLGLGNDGAARSSRSRLGTYLSSCMFIKMVWNLSVTTTSIMNFVARDLFSNMFWWWLKVPNYSCSQFLPSGAHLGVPWPPRWSPEGREVSH